MLHHGGRQEERKTMTREEKINIVRGLIIEGMRSGKFLHVDFIKKTTGEMRPMTVRKSKLLEASVKGTAPKATAARKETYRIRDLLLVEELVQPENKFQWRTVNLEGVKRIACNGQVHTFE